MAAMRRGYGAACFSFPGIRPLLTTSITARDIWFARWPMSNALMNCIAGFHTPQAAINLPSEDPLNPRTYTNGRWLYRDKLERDARYIEFNFDELCKRIIELCPGAGSIASYEKKEGGYNRVFIFTCDNWERIVARLPTWVAGPSRLTTNSEVATIKYRESERPFRSVHYG